MKSKLPACLAISSALRETTTSSAPRRRASSFLLGDVVNSTTWAPRACANLTPMWPSPPRPATPTFLPLVTPQWCMGRVGCDARAEERCGPGEVEIRGDLEDESLGDDDAVGVAPVGDAAS